MAKNTADPVEAPRRAIRPQRVGQQKADPFLDDHQRYEDDQGFLKARCRWMAA